MGDYEPPQVNVFENVPREARTPDLEVNSLTLQPTELWKHVLMYSLNDGAVAVKQLFTMTTTPSKPNHDTVSERLRRWTRNPLGSARRGGIPSLSFIVLLAHHHSRSH